MDERKRQIYGNGERYFFYVSYGILTDERNSYVLLQRSTKIRLRMNGNVTQETRHKKQADHDTDTVKFPDDGQPMSSGSQYY